MPTLTIFPDYDATLYAFVSTGPTRGSWEWQYVSDQWVITQRQTPDGKYGFYSETYGCLHFPVTAIPAGVTITAASLYASSDYGSNGYPYKLIPVYGATIPAQAGSTASYVVRSDANLASNAPNAGASMAWHGLASLVAGWKAGAQNFGVAIEMVNELTGVYYRFFSNESGSKPYLSVTYNTAPTAPVVTSPNGGNVIDQSTLVTWTAATDPEGDTLQYNLQYSPNGGANWYDIVALVSGTSYTWNTSALAAGSNYLVRIRAYDGNAYGPFDQSNATFTISHQLPTPTNVTPAQGATVTTDVPTLGATLGQSSSHKAQWQLATDAAFTQNVRTITEPDSDVRIGGATTEVVPNADQLFQGTWYIRARGVPATGGASNPSNYSAGTTFVVAHPSSMANQSPTADTKRPFGVNGSVVLDWDFSDASPVDTQTAYQAQVEVAGTGAVILDTGKVTSTVTQVSVNIPGAQKDVQLRWRGQVWDSDNVTAGYSGYHLFRVADVPVVTVGQPADGGLMTQPQPQVTWTMTASGGRIQKARRVRFVRVSDSVTVHDSGWTDTTDNNYIPPTPVLVLGVVYDVIVDLRDDWLLEGSDTNRATATWTAPAAPIFTVVA